MTLARSPRAARLAVFATSAVVIGVGVLAWRSVEPPPVEASEAEPLAARVAALATSPRPPGSPAHAAARERIVGWFEEAGCAVELQDGFAWRARRATSDGLGRWVGAFTRNVLAECGGASGTPPRVLLAAHYDTPPWSPGAGDDAAGVVAAVAVAERLARDGEGARVLITDAEELGLLGARAFVGSEHPWIGSTPWAVNLEGRGRTGAVVLFETAGPDLEIARALDAGTDEAVAYSVAADVYRRMPNDTDFTVFREAGFGGGNLAFLGDISSYHTVLDRSDRLDRRTLSHLVESGEALARGLAARTGAEETSGRPGAYGVVAGLGLLVLPWVAVMAILGVALVLTGIAVWRLRRGEDLGGGMVGPALRSLLAAALVPVGAGVFWHLALSIAPGLASGPHGLPPRAGWALVGLAMVAAAPAVTVARTVRASIAETAAAVAGIFVVSGLVAVWLMPGAVFASAVPALGLAAGAVAGAYRGRDSAMAAAPGALAGVAILGPLALLAAEAFTAAVPAAALSVVALVVLSVFPLLVALGRKAQAVLLVVLLVGGAGAILVSGHEAEGGEGPMSSDSLLYAVDRGTEDAVWAGRGEGPPDWTGIEGTMARDAVDESAESGVVRLVDERSRAWVAAAPALDLAAPEVEVLADERVGAGRQIRFRVRSVRGAPVLRLRVTAQVPIERFAVGVLEIDGVEIDGESIEPGFVADLHGVGADWVDFEIDVPSRWPVELLAADVTWGLPGEGVGIPSSRPAGTVPAPGWSSDSIIVGREHLL